MVPPDVPHTLLCSGGVDHINVQPDGSAWRCILERQMDSHSLGNVFAPGFELLTSPSAVRRILGSVPHEIEIR